ncbi:RNA polymerase sigma factor [Polyangium sp. 6x1]|uniref:RNA polymerase sigma factor n=1 Tax=Polyangium sp. 6x1 TaxID=3042689 RepID=UPI0024829423|nr:RNA polymerase sigma factor [Polyangium sp. 6x1]
MLDLDALLPAIAAGDADAFGRFLAGAEGRVRASLRPYATRVDTEAVLQETLLRVWQVAPRHAPDGRPNSLLRLAIRIGRNLCIDDLRRARLAPVETDDLDEAHIDPVEPRAPDPLLRKLIADCHEKLPDKPAEVLAARLASGGTEPDETLAERLGMRINTFLQNFTRARKMLAECLEKHHVDLSVELR